MIGNYKIYKVVLCECGCFCPIDYAVIDEDGYYICPNCYIQELEALFIDDSDEFIIKPAL